MGVQVREQASGVRFDVRVQPRASADEIAGLHDGAVRIRLKSPPVDGAANEALVAFLADRLGVNRRQVRIVGGFTSRRKTIEIDGIDRARVESLASDP
jgi:uncharacterized protein (TIGR00251 family)